MYPWTFMLFLIATASLSYGISKYYEGENRPYEFGFNIGGHQHRHESKDKNGIIMGEFGFITGDGVYHVTAYATDENGNFKILFMKNIKIGLPGNQSTNALQLPKQPPPQNKITTVSPPQAVEPEKTKPLPLRPGDTRTCSGCAIPKEQIENQPVVNLREKSLNLNKMTNYMKNNVKEIVQARRIAPNQISESFTESRGDSPKVQPHSVSGPISTTNLRTQQRSQPEKPKKKPTGSTKQIGREIQSAQDKFNESPGGYNRTVQTRRMPPNQIFESFTENRGDSPKVRPHPVSGGPISTTNLQTQQRSQPEKPKKKPTGSTKQIGRGTHKLNESPGGNNRNVSVDRESLEQMRRAFVGLLYKFNYTVGFHGHHEKGDFVGSKDGDYYFVGRDGLRRNVEYVANEFGYQPYLTQEQAAGEDVPKKETEKEAGLKGYEFKWFSERE